MTRPADQTAEFVPLVRVSALLPFLAFLERIGAPIDRRLSEARIPGHLLDDPEALIPLRQSFLLLADAARGEGLAHLGLIVGQRTPFQNLGAFGRVVVRSPTLYDALSRIAAVIPLYNSAQRIWIERRDERAAVCVAYNPKLDGWQFGEQYTLALLVNAIRIAAGPDWHPAEVHLESTLFDLLRHAPDLFGGAPRRRSRVSAVILDEARISTPMPGRGRARGDAGAGDEDYQALIASAPSVDFPGSVAQLARMFLGDEHAQQSWIAEAAGVSVRTIQRRLARSGIAYSAMIQKARFESATRLMQDPDRDLTDIAFEIGYTDASSFTRAFRQWTGVPPSTFRKRHLAAGGA